MIRTAYLVALGLAVSPIIGCSGAASEPVVESSKRPGEEIRLSQEQVERIGIELLELKTATLSRVNESTGWLEVPQGGEVVLRAPVAGFLAKAGNGRLPVLGEKVPKSGPCAVVQMFLSPLEISQLVVAKEDADIQIQQSQVTMQLAEAQLRRLKDAPNAVAGTRVDEVRDLYERSKIALFEAREKLPFLVSEPYDKSIPLKPVNLTSPISGVITQAHAVDGQLLLQGDPVWTIGDWSTLWLRVPVFEGDLAAVRRDAPAFVRYSRSGPAKECAPVQFPVPTKPLTRTIDVVYVVDNRDGAFRPGQALVVGLPLAGQTDAVVVPRSAVVYDTWGTAFVYVQPEPQEFVRRRVELGPPTAAGFPIVHGVAAGEVVVTTGAAALHAEESKSTLAVEDDD